jgi:hypothetical protein
MAGAGGLATASLTVNDTGKTAAASLSAYLQADGGDGGYATNGGGDAAGGAATATGTITGVQGVSVTAYAYGGYAGNSSAGAAGGNASVGLTVTGATVNASGTAVGGAGRTSSGVANATVTGTGSSGMVTSQAISNGIGGSRLDYVSSYASAGVNGKSVAQTVAGIGSGYTTGTKQGEAIVVGLPGSNVTQPITALNPNIGMYLGTASSPNFFGVEELGGGHSASGSDMQTSDNVGYFEVNLTPQDVGGTLQLGLFGGMKSGGGVSGVTVDIQVNGTTILDMSFTAAGAVTEFTDNVLIPPGSSNAGIPLGGLGSTVDVRAEVTVVGTGGGFWGGLIISG